MAIAHLCVSHVSRKSKRSAPAAAAYRSGSRIVNPRDGVVHDYRRRRGVWHSEILTPDQAPAWAADRSQLWGAIEMHDTRANARTATEVEFALPFELDPDARLDLARRFASSLSQEHHVAADLAIHSPDARSKPTLAQDGSPLPGGDPRNWHCHVLLSTWTIGPDGFGSKVKPFDRPADLERARARWEQICNAALEAARISERIDMRSYERQGRTVTPGQHLAPAVIALAAAGKTTEQYEKYQAALRANQINADLAEIDVELGRRAAAQEAAFDDRLPDARGHTGQPTRGAVAPAAADRYGRGRDPRPAGTERGAGDRQARPDHQWAALAVRGDQSDKGAVAAARARAVVDRCRSQESLRALADRFSIADANSHQRVEQPGGPAGASRGVADRPGGAPLKGWSTQDQGADDSGRSIAGEHRRERLEHVAERIGITIPVRADRSMAGADLQRGSGGAGEAGESRSADEAGPATVVATIAAARNIPTDRSFDEQVATLTAAIGAAEALPATLKNHAARAGKLAAEMRRLPEAVEGRQKAEAALQRLYSATKGSSGKPPGIEITIFGRTLFRSKQRRQAIDAQRRLSSAEAELRAAIATEQLAEITHERRHDDWAWLTHFAELRSVAADMYLLARLREDLQAVQRRHSHAVAALRSMDDKILSQRMADFRAAELKLKSSSLSNPPPTTKRRL